MMLAVAQVTIFYLLCSIKQNGKQIIIILAQKVFEGNSEEKKGRQLKEANIHENSQNNHPRVQCVLRKTTEMEREKGAVRKRVIILFKANMHWPFCVSLIGRHKTQTDKLVWYFFICAGMQMTLMCYEEVYC